MIRRSVKVLDSLLALGGAAVFLVFAAAMIVAGAFRTRDHATGKISELYLSIIDFRHAVLSTDMDDVVLDGLISKCFAFHFDFEKDHDERVPLRGDIVLHNISVHPDSFMVRMGLTRTRAALAQIRAFAMMAKTGRNENVSVILAQDPHLLGVNAYLLSCILKVPFIIQICSNYELKDRQAKGLTFGPFVFQRIERAVERFIMKRADLVMTDRDHYRAFGLIPEEVDAQHYGNIGFYVEKAHYEPVLSRHDLRSELGLPADGRILLYVGRLAAVKYPLDLLTMAAHVMQRRNDVTLLLVGSGPLREEMEERARGLGIARNVRFLGMLDQEALADVYHTADVVCFTSAGFTMIEAALAEKCIVAYDFEWHEEFIGKNERGRLVPFRDDRVFAEEVLRVLDDNVLRRTLGRSARMYALENYTREASIRKGCEYYRRVLAKVQA